ncbi:MAG: antitoxin Xre/MbcA/ParS toxin-binding domain-containing protein [Bryobacteraceae bacterium]
MANPREEQERLANPVPSTEPLAWVKEPQLPISSTKLDEAAKALGEAVIVALASAAATQIVSKFLEGAKKDSTASDIAKIQSLATQVFDDEKSAVAWLHEPNLATDNLPPMSVLGTPDGYKRVQNLLLRIQYGVLA